MNQRPRVPSPDRPIQLKGSLAQMLDVEVDTLIRVKKARDSFNVSGQGLTVAILDTGLRITHHDFTGRIVAKRNFTDDNEGVDDVSDKHGHGTNVTGIVAAKKGDHTGVAFGASIVPLKVLKNNGSSDFTNIQDGLQWVLDNYQKFDISVVNMALGDGQNHDNDNLADEEDTFIQIHTLIQKLRDVHIPVVVAVGNLYHKFEDRQGMGFPAILRETISVGSVYDANIGPQPAYPDGSKAYSTAADRITPFSQRLHESVNPDCHTVIFAPGSIITSSGISSDDGQSSQSGTSQAAPVITGIVMLMQELYQRAKVELPDVDFLKTCLQNGSVTIFDGDDEHDNVIHTKAKFLRVDAMNALDAVRRQLQIELMNAS